MHAPPPLIQLHRAALKTPCLQAADPRHILAFGALVLLAETPPPPSNIPVRAHKHVLHLDGFLRPCFSTYSTTTPGEEPC